MIDERITIMASCLGNPWHVGMVAIHTEKFKTGEIENEYVRETTFGLRVK